jgi:hypothetical protein
MTPAQQRTEARLGEQLGRHGAVLAQAARSAAHPGPSIGARQANDGEWYVPDPMKRGSYLRVDAR